MRTNKRRILFIILLTLITCPTASIRAQNFTKIIEPYYEEFMSNEYFIDPSKELLLLFEFEIDSLGEIRRAVILGSENFNLFYEYTICHYIEVNINMLELYTGAAISTLYFYPDGIPFIYYAVPFNSKEIDFR